MIRRGQVDVNLIDFQKSNVIRKKVLRIIYTLMNRKVIFYQTKISLTVLKIASKSSKIFSMLTKKQLRLISRRNH